MKKSSGPRWSRPPHKAGIDRGRRRFSTPISGKEVRETQRAAANEKDDVSDEEVLAILERPRP